MMSSTAVLWVMPRHLSLPHCLSLQLKVHTDAFCLWNTAYLDRGELKWGRRTTGGPEQLERCPVREVGFSEEPSPAHLTSQPVG